MDNTVSRRRTSLSPIAWGLISAVLVLAWAMPTEGQTPLVFTKLSTDGTAIPDVNKSPLPPLPTDQSCWLASAANLLGAAGYGTGPSAQSRAQSIYGQLTTDYGTGIAGAPDQAISYWLGTYGKNPASIEYKPAASYTDVTAVYRTLTATDYAFLKSELYRCQYVGVQFDYPPHAMTLVGWDDNLGRSVWHDSDIDTVPSGDDVYVNAFSPNWDLVVPGTTPAVTYESRANGYVTLCPGLNKDPEVVANYDIAWMPSPTGPRAREAGTMVGVFDPPPGWQPTPWVDPNTQASFVRFQVDNELDLQKEKHIELLVDYYGRDATYASRDIRLRYLDALKNEVVISATATVLSADNGQVLFTWDLPIQPEWEELLFPNAMDYRFLEGEVAYWDMAVLCVPEPSVPGLLWVSGIALLVRRSPRHGRRLA